MSARSLLYTPGDRAPLHAKALTSGADAVIFDLEDAVAPSMKEQAAQAVATTLAGAPAGGPDLWVRVEPELVDEQLAALGDGLAVLRGVVLPKSDLGGASRAHDALTRAERHVGLAADRLGVIALLETADGILDARPIARSPRVVQLAVGEVDLGASLGMSSDAMTWDAIRAQVVLASAAAGLDGPIAPVYRQLHDEAGLISSCVRFARAGYRGRTILSPRQAITVHAHFGPTKQQIAWARSVAQTAQDARETAVSLTADGEMIDVAVLRRAISILERAESRGSDGSESM